MAQRGGKASGRVASSEQRAGEPLRFGRAELPGELEQVHRLNYRTFVEEIPQHRANPERRLVDPRLARSACFVALRGPRLVGMVAVSGERPFSLDDKLPDLDSYLPRRDGLCEIRLLAVEPQERGRRIFPGLIAELLAHCREQGYELGLISATTRQLALYRHLGFEPFGPLLGDGEARFQGMLVTWDRLGRAARRLGRWSGPDERPKERRR